MRSRTADTDRRNELSSTKKSNQIVGMGYFLYGERARGCGLFLMCMHACMHV